MASEAASTELKVNWQKTKFQALASREDEPLTFTVQGQEVAVVIEEFVYLGSHTTQQLKALLISHVAVLSLVWLLQNLDNQIWKSRISISTKLNLYNTMFVHYISECLAVTKTDAQKIDALDQW